MSDSSPKSPESQRKATPLTITSRATFAFNSLKKPKINREPIGNGEPYGPHDLLSKTSKEKIGGKSDGEAEITSETDSPRRREASLDVPRQRSKLKASRYSVLI